LASSLAGQSTVGASDQALGTVAALQVGDAGRASRAGGGDGAQAIGGDQPTRSRGRAASLFVTPPGVVDATTRLSDNVLGSGRHALDEGRALASCVA
jgi:hypothetical protein